ncbi:hypothetical protein STENM223S_05019 [Streptomyces tendae]
MVNRFREELHAGAEASHDGLFGVLAGWLPALAAYAVHRRRARESTQLRPLRMADGAGRRRPAGRARRGRRLGGGRRARRVHAAECVSAHAGIVFTGEITLRLALPAWAAAIAVLAAARRSDRVRGLRTLWQVLVGAGAAGLAVLFAPGLVFGASV